MGVLTDVMSGMSGGAAGKIAAGLKKRGGSKGGKPGSGGGGVDSAMLTGDTAIDSYHKGGKVRKTGLARLKKGEQVLTAKQARMKKRSGGKRR